MDPIKIAKTLSRMAGEDPEGTDKQGSSYFPRPHPISRPGVPSSSVSKSRSGQNWTAHLDEAREFIAFYERLP